MQASVVISDGLETRVHWSSFCPGLGLET